MNIHTVPVHRPNMIRQFQSHLLLVTGVLLFSILLRLFVNISTTISQQALSSHMLTLHDDENALLIAMINQETGLRGYIATADPTFLQPFYLGRSQYLSTTASLNTLLQRDGWQDGLPAFFQVQAHTNAWYRMFALPQLYQMHQGNFALPRSQRSALSGKALFDTFRQSLAELQQIIDHDGAFLLKQQVVLNWSFLAVASIIAFLVIFLLWYVFFSFRRDFSTQLTLLTTAAQQFQTGQHRARVPALKHEEMEFVGQTFNRLVEAVEHQYTIIEEHMQQVDTVNGEFRALFNAVKSAILFVSRDRLILAVNRSFMKFFQVSAESVIGQPLDTFRKPWASLFVDSFSMLEFLHSYEHDEAATITASASQRTPEKREMEVQSLPVTTKAGYLGRLYTFQDVTKEHELERMKRDFVSQVSHELRTPLTSIKGFVELLLEEPDHLNKEQGEFLQIVLENTHRLIALVNDLLDLARIESGKMDLERTALVLNPLIETTLQSFTLPLAGKHQSLEVSLEIPSPEVFADPARVQQILSNLVSNAHKYTLPGGTLRVSTQVEHHQVWIAVQDSGVGMTPEEQVHLFNQFFRAKNRLTKDVGGTGLGLAITRSLVELHGGVMQVESQPGQGSIFRFSLPLDAATFHPTPTSPLRSSGKKRVLVAEDDLDTASLLQHLCEQHGYEVLLAHSGQEAVRLAIQELPDLMVLDLILPDISGFAALEAIKQHAQTAELPIVLLSLLDREGGGRYLGFIDYLPKPFQQEEMLAHLRSVLRDAPTSILVFANDEEGSQLREYAQKYGYTVITASTSAQLLALVQRHRPSLIVLDSELPPDGGLVAWQVLRSAPEQAISKIPILVLAAREGILSEQWTAIEQAGGIELLGYPCQMEEIVNAITHCLAGGVKV